MVRRRRRQGELHRLGSQHVASRRLHLHEAVLTQQKPRGDNLPLIVRDQALGTRHRLPRVVGLHLLQSEHGARQSGRRFGGVHLRQHGLAVFHLHAARYLREMRRARRRFSRAVAIGERGGVLVLAGCRGIGAQLDDERREIALVRPRCAEVLHDDVLLRRRRALVVEQLRKAGLALAIQDVADVERARAVARGNAAEPYVDHPALPHADRGLGGEAHAVGKLALRRAVSLRGVHKCEQVVQRVNRVLLGLRLARIRRGHDGQVHLHVGRRDGLAALQFVGEQKVALLRRGGRPAGSVIRIRVHDVVEVHAHVPYDLVLAGHLRTVFQQRRVRQRPGGWRVDADGRQR